MNDAWQMPRETVTRREPLEEFIERVEVYEKYISGDALSDVETQVEEVTKEKETNKIYVVESGDVLSVIAMDHDTTVANIMALNGFDNAEVRFIRDRRSSLQCRNRI